MADSFVADALPMGYLKCPKTLKGNLAGPGCQAALELRQEALELRPDEEEYAVALLLKLADGKWKKASKATRKKAMEEA